MSAIVKTGNKLATVQKIRTAMMRIAAGRMTMAILVLALIMASAMMIAAFRSIYIEQRADMYRVLRAGKPGHFA